MEGEPEQFKPAEAPVYHPGPRLVLKPGRPKTILKHCIAEVAEHS